MALTGLSMNMITLVALLMSIGIVMDDAIVITDNIAAHADEGATPLGAVVSGTRQVLPGVLSSFLTTVAVFAPLSFLAGVLDPAPPSQGQSQGQRGEVGRRARLTLSGRLRATLPQCPGGRPQCGHRHRRPADRRAAPGDPG
ncbi:efflux RND transporter permease subunit [Halomonas sp. HK25]|uniref:efflux RND transporter permease subunit n=1 Tax=Halomonas sp. HK25 TaxID=3394321 RepID=UPI0039FCD463